MHVSLPAAALFFLWSAAAWADRAQDVLQRVDERANRAVDTFFSFQATTQEPGRKAREMAFSVRNKGVKRLVEFHAPGDMRGTRVLVLSRRQMYVYLPAYNKVRRVASHVTQQGFMGTTYSDEDMSTTRFAMVFDATVLSEADGVVRLSLLPKKGQKSGYARMEMDVQIELGLPSELRFFNAEGQHLKTEERTDYDCGGDICTPGLMRMTDHSRGDAWTTLKVLERRVNTGVSDASFSVRNLERGG